MIIPKSTKQFEPYIAGEQGACRVKLNTNENAFPPSAAVKDVLKNFDVDKFRRYPDGACNLLRAEIAKKEGVKKENVFCGNGSDEVLAFCFRTFFDGFTPTFSDITYAFYPVYCKLFGINRKVVPLLSGGKQNLKEFIGCDGAVIANPNAPTSLIEASSDIMDVVRSTQKAVIVDEAYIEFSDAVSLAKTAASADNLIVVKTLSKSYSLAGLRVGYAVASEEAIGALEAIRDGFNSYTVDAAAQEVAIAALRDEKYHVDCVNKIIAYRDSLTRELRSIDGVTVNESATNFILINLSEPAKRVYEELKADGILVRYFAALPNSLRVTVGTESDNAEFLAAFKRILRAK